MIQHFILKYFPKIYQRFFKPKSPLNELRRSPRIKNHATYDLKLFIGAENNSFKVSNISTTGIGFQNDGREWPNPSSLLKGKLKINQQEFPLDLKIVHSTKTHVGCQFENINEKLQRWILNYFESEFTATHVQPVNSNLLLQNSLYQPLWFWGGENCELYCLNGPEGLTHFHILYFNNYFEWSSNNAPIYGIIKDHETFLNIKPSSLVSPLYKIPPDLIKKVIKFINYIESLDLNIKNTIICKLSEMES